MNAAKELEQIIGRLERWQHGHPSADESGLASQAKTRLIDLWNRLRNESNKPPMKP